MPENTCLSSLVSTSNKGITTSNKSITTNEYALLLDQWPEVADMHGKVARQLRLLNVLQKRGTSRPLK